MNETAEKTAEVQAPAPNPGGQKRRPARRMRRLVPLLVLLALAAGGGGYYVYHQRQLQGAAPAYTDHVVARGTVEQVIAESAVLEARDRREITSLVGGSILGADFAEGQTVQAGDLLYALDASDASKALEQQAFAVQRARLALEDAALRSAELTVTAPAGGLITAIYAKNGDLVAANFAIATLADPDALSLTVPFLEWDARALVPGQTAEITLAATGETLSGVVDRAATGTTVGAAGVRLVNVIIAFENPGALAPGSRATAAVGGVACQQAGEIAYREEYALRVKRAGELAGFDLIAGDAVSAGETVARLLDPGAETALETATLNLAEAESALRRGRESLADYELRAPISGTVVQKTADAGDKVSATAPGTLAVVADLTALRCPLDVDEMDVARVRAGQGVRLTADACPGEEYLGTVESVELMGSASGGVTTYTVWVSVTDYGALRPGMNVRAEITVARAEDVLVLPQAALGEESRVLVKGGDGGYTPVPVETGLTAGGLVEITGGLDEGAVVGLP